MIRLMLLLLGADAIRRRWRSMLLGGGLWCAIGLFIFGDALDNLPLIPVHDFGYLLLIEALFTLLACSGLSGMTRQLRLAKGCLLLLVGGLTIDAPWRSDVVLALLLGGLFGLDGAMKIATARLIRFPGWRATEGAGFLSLLLAIATLEPWPTWYVGTIGCNIGIALVLSGLAIVRLALRVRRMAPSAPISSLLLAGFAPWDTAAGAELFAIDGSAAPCEMVVHVWTPAGAAATVRRPVIDRYIAAVDTSGTISTGHAALELPPDLYISHYPAVDIDRSPDDFARLLRATAENDVPGRFLPSYSAEATQWCEANAHVRFRDFDARRLRAFWADYQMVKTYNLTKRNCSSAVAQALDAALEGRLAHRRPRWSTLLGAALSPELWVASLLRKRAESMAWTPGLVLDYARALSAVIDPPSIGWTTLLRLALRRRRRHAKPASTARPTDVAR